MDVYRGMRMIPTKIVALAVVAGSLPALAACAGAMGHTPPAGILYSGAKGVQPGTQVQASDGKREGALTGEACAMGVLGLAAWGDMSVAAAKTAGGITTVDTLDFKTMDILGVIFQKHCTVVTGTSDMSAAAVPVVPQVAPAPAPAYQPQPGQPAQPYGQPQPGQPAQPAQPGQPAQPYQPPPPPGA